MEKIKEEKENLELLTEKLYNINPYSAESSLKADSTALYLLEMIEKYNKKKIANVIKKFIVGNLKYSYQECIEIIDGVVFRCDDYIKNMNSNSSKMYDKYIQFVDEFNSYDLEYKISKDISLEISYLDDKQKNINKDIEIVNKKYEEMSKKIDKANYDLIGTISLFVGIIFTIYSGFNLTTSVFKYIGKIEFAYLLIALLVIGFIELSIVSLLVYLIFKINDKDGKEIWSIDIFYFIVMLMCIITILIIV